MLKFIKFGGGQELCWLTAYGMTHIDQFDQLLVPYSKEFNVVGFIFRKNN